MIAGYFDSWFGEVKKAVDYKGQRVFYYYNYYLHSIIITIINNNNKVCFTNGLFVPPEPGVAWFWDGFIIIIVTAFIIVIVIIFIISV